MSEEKVQPKPIDLGEYKFGFHDDVEPVLSTGKGLNEAVIRELSAAKNEPEWMHKNSHISPNNMKLISNENRHLGFSKIRLDITVYSRFRRENSY